MTWKETAKKILGVKRPNNKPSAPKQMQVSFSKEKKL